MSDTEKTVREQMGLSASVYHDDGRLRETSRARLGITRPCAGTDFCRLPLTCRFRHIACADEPTPAATQ